MAFVTVLSSVSVELDDINGDLALLLNVWLEFAPIGCVVCVSRSGFVVGVMANIEFSMFSLVDWPSLAAAPVLPGRFL